MQFQLQVTDHAKRNVGTMSQIALDSDADSLRCKVFAHSLAKFIISGEFEHPLDMTDVDFVHQQEIVRQTREMLHTVDSIETLHAFVRGMSTLVTLDYALVTLDLASI